MWLEVGCGVGNAFFPLLEEDITLFVHACDLSQRAIQFVKVTRTWLTSLALSLLCSVRTRMKLTTLGERVLALCLASKFLSLIHI